MADDNSGCDYNEIRSSLKEVNEGQRKVELAVNSLTEQMKPCVNRIDNLEGTVFGKDGLEIKAVLVESQQEECKKEIDKLVQRTWKLIATVVTTLIAIIGSALTFFIKGE